MELVLGDKYNLLRWIEFIWKIRTFDILCALIMELQVFDYGTSVKIYSLREAQFL